MLFVDDISSLCSVPLSRSGGSDSQDEANERKTDANIVAINQLK
jgi:hypothetical protein